jgi:hypothetical protein
VVQELVALFQKNKELMAAAMKLLKQDWVRQHLLK